MSEYRVSLQPAVLYEFLERHPEHGPEYVLATAEMIKRNYPDRADEILPRLRQIYAAKKREKLRRK